MRTQVTKYGIIVSTVIEAIVYKVLIESENLPDDVEVENPWDLSEVREREYDELYEKWHRCIGGGDVDRLGERTFDLLCSFHYLSDLDVCAFYEQFLVFCMECGLPKSLYNELSSRIKFAVHDRFENDNDLRFWYANKFRVHVLTQLLRFCFR